MKQVWKFLLAFNTTVEMPEGAKLLCVAGQAEAVCLWAEVDPTADKVIRHFDVFGTGHNIPAAVREYIGTAHICGGSLVFHVYERFSKVAA